MLANLTILLLLLHVGAALKHHVWNRDDVLRRMLPFVR
ncbi:MAG: cytochrome b/b6 domain-containing protein [Phycisphaerae bacterium]